LNTPSWTAWRGRPKADLSGSWVVAGHVPGGRDFYGVAEIKRDASGDYQARYVLKDIEGSAVNGESKALVYTGYEWRGTAQYKDRTRREVFHVSEDGSRISGRWFDADHSEDGGDWTAVRDAGPSQILAVWPKSLRVGSRAALTVVGVGLGQENLSLGEGLAANAVQRDAHVIRADITAAANATPGRRRVAVGGAGAELAVYSQVDALEVTPKYGIARLGGGRVDPVTAQFEALGSSRLASGETLPLGPMAVEWSTTPYTAEAKRTEDEKYAGYIDRRGRFLPSAAGPNPAREFSGNNVGDLAVVGTMKDGEHELKAQGHLIVTVQRWITPPIY
jgi:quinohemoprotein amine dehydrogenase